MDLDKVGKTALHWAAKKNALSCVQLLLESGAEPSVEDKDKKRPLDETTNQEILELLTVRRAEMAPIIWDQAAYAHTDAPKF